MASDLSINVNGRSYPVEASPDTPLLYVLIERACTCMVRASAAGSRNAARARCLLDGVEVAVVRRRLLRPSLAKR